MKHSSRRLFAAVVLLLALALCGYAQEAQQPNTSGQQTGAAQGAIGAGREVRGGQQAVHVGVAMLAEGALP